MTGAAPGPAGLEEDPVAEAAAAWLASRQEGSCDDEAFSAWLAADPAHKIAYDRLAHGWAALAALETVPRLQAMRSEALMVNPPRRRFLPWAGAAAAAALALGLVAGPQIWSRLDPSGGRPTSAAGASAALAANRDLRTVKGERSTLTLPDGSTITLNTATRVRLAYTPSERRVLLLAGQAYFQVAKDRAHPFIVSAGDREVVAVGTEFEVRLDPRRVAIALLEGKVKVRMRTDRPRAASEPPVAEAVLAPGERLVFAPASAETRIAAADVADLTSWREGRVRFDETPLAEAVAEMNRYGQVPIRIADPRLAEIRVSGVFRTGQTTSFVAALTELFPVRSETGPQAIELRRAS